MNLWKYRLAQLISSAQPSRTKDLTGRGVLMYHSIGENNKNDIYTISKQYFASHVEVLAGSCADQNFQVVTLEDEQNNGVSITFDDGYSDTLTIAARLLCEKRLPFTVFVTPQNIISGDPRYLSKTQLVELSKMVGVTIGSHGFSHRQLGSLSVNEIHKELKQGKVWLEDVIGKSINSMSYPHGSYNADVVNIAAEIGYKYAATSEWGRFEVGSNLLQIPRIDIWSYDTQRTLRQKISGKWDLVIGLI